jgi:hypothetical protein
MSSIPDDKLVPLQQELDCYQSEHADFDDRFMDGTVPWSDDLLDAGIHYVKICRELMGIVDDE